MGNSNSGNHGGKRITSDMRTLDVRKMLRDGQLQADRWLFWNWSQWGEVVATLQINVETDGVMLQYRRKAGDTWQSSMNQSVRLVWTACHYGGQRPWWLCPITNCGRRVAVLYAGSVFACRHCQQLAYKSQRETPDSRAFRRANKLREQLGWVPGVIHGPGSKPKGMHWATFWRLHAAQDAATLQALGGANERVNKLVTSMERMMVKRRA